MRAENPTISVIVPTYNVHKYITFCIDSILRQTFQDFELIIVDDISTDGTFEICQRLYGQLEGVKLIRNSVNKGQWYARNMGIIHGKGKYVYFMDNDDELLPWALETLYRKAEEEQADVVHANLWCNVYVDGRMMSRVHLWRGSRCIDSDAGEVKEMTAAEKVLWQASKSMPMPWLNLYRRDFLLTEGIRFPEMTFWEDNIFAIEVLLKAKKYVRINEMLYLYRCYFDQKGRMVNRFPKCFPYVPIILDSFKRIFSAFTEEAFPSAYRRYIISQLLMAYLKYCIYDIMSSKNEDAFAKIRECLHLSGLAENDFLAYLLYIIEDQTDIREVIANERKEKITNANKFFDELNSGKSPFMNNYSYIYCEAKLATYVEDGDESFYCKAYEWLGSAALEIGKPLEAVEAYEKAASWARQDSEDFRRISEKEREARRYVDTAWEKFAREKRPCSKSHATCEEEGTSEVEVSVASGITFGAVLHYRQINDGILVMWREIMEQIPGAMLLIKAKEFCEEEMMKEAGERLAEAGIDLRRVRCQEIGEDYLAEYQDIDILLGTYPVQEAERLLDALYMGVPVIVLAGQGDDAQLCKRVLSKVGLKEFASKNGEEYVRKAVELAYNPEKLKDLHGSLRKKLEETSL